MKDIEDEIPFDVPDGWAWCRLKEVCELKGGKRIPAGLSATKEKTNHIYIRVTDMQNNSISDADLVYITDDIFEKIQRYTINKDDLYLTIAGTIGRVGEVPEIFDGMNLTENALKLTNISICKKYLMQILNTKLVQDYFESTYHQVAMPKLSLINASKTIIPVPPLDEQQLIVEKIEKIFAQIDLLEQNKTDLQTAIKQAKSKILDLAIHGKLVSQDPNDESASVLLEKIRAEKEAKIAKGELKRDKNYSYIYKGSDNCHYQKNADGSIVNIEDEIPFEVPDGWCWVRIPEISNTIFAGGDKPEIYEKEITESCNIPIFSNGIEKDGLYGYTNKAVVDKPCITISARGTIGYTCIRNEPFVPIVRLVTIIPNEIINLVYIKIVFDSLLVVGEGSSIPQLTVPTVKQVLFPLPPLTEQTRIVAKIEELFTLLDNIQNNLI